MELEILIDSSENFVYDNEEMDENTHDNIIIKILIKAGFVLSNNIEELDGLLITRDLLIDHEKYTIVKEYLNDLKKMKMFSSSFLTSLHKDAEKKQKWPLLNLIRQILKVNYYRMKPIRKSAGKTNLGKKRYVRYFLIEKLKKKELDS